MLVENCDIYTPGYQAVEVDGHCIVRNTSLQGSVTGNATTENVDENVDRTPPKGVPMSAEAAASGTGGGGTGSERGGSSRDGTADDAGETGDGGTGTHRLSIAGGSPSNVARYEFRVTGSVEKTTARDATIDEDDAVDGGAVSGGVAGATDSYRFAGELASFSLDGDATVYLDGQQVDPNDLGE
jgi:hypothetical protein